MGEEDERVGTRLEGRYEGLEARPRETNGPSREAGAERSAPFPSSPCLRMFAWPWKGRGGLIMPSLRSLEKTAVSAPPSTEIELSSAGPCTGDLHVYSPSANRRRNSYGKFYVSFKVTCAASSYIISVLKIIRTFKNIGRNEVISRSVHSPSNPSSSHWQEEWGNWNSTPLMFECLLGSEYEYRYEVLISWASLGGIIVGEDGAVLPPGEERLTLSAQEECGHGSY